MGQCAYDPIKAYRRSEEVTKELFPNLLSPVEHGTHPAKLACDMFVCLLRVEDPGEGVKGEDLNRKHCGRYKATR